MGYTIERGGDREAINRIDAAQRHRAICGRADRSCYCLFVSTGVKGPPVPSLRPRTTAAPPMGRAVVVALRSARCCSGCTTASALHGSESACLGSSPQRPLLSGRPVSRSALPLVINQHPTGVYLVTICPCTESSNFCARTACVRLHCTCLYHFTICAPTHRLFFSRIVFFMASSTDSLTKDLTSYDVYAISTGAMFSSGFSCSLALPLPKRARPSFWRIW